MVILVPVQVGARHVRERRHPIQLQPLEHVERRVDATLGLANGRGAPSAARVFVPSGIDEVDGLNEAQWNWKLDESRWSIAQVIEHLIVHDELFYRETRVLTRLPIMTPQEDSLFAKDEIIFSYREITPENTGKSPSYMEPLGRWCSKDDAVFAYTRVRKA